MKTRTVVAGAALLVFVTGASATLLETYGTVSGTADVEPALRVTEVDVDGDQERIEVYNPSEVSVDLTAFDLEVGDTSDEPISELNGSEIGSKEAVVVAENDFDSFDKNERYFEAGSFAIDDDSETSIELISGSNNLVVDSVSVNGECSDSNENRVRDSIMVESFSCKSSSIGEYSGTQ